jgi:NTE family protein
MLRRATERRARLKPKIALALSGGGFRASFFHLGVMKRLAEVNLLPQVQLISTVSGGSIVGAFAVLRWEKWLQAGGDAAAFDQVVIAPFRDLVERNNLLARWLAGGWLWPFRKLADRTFSRTQAMAELLTAEFFAGANCADLPANPILVLNATSLQSMRAWRFTKYGFGDSRVGHALWAGEPLPLGVCVGASAAFPPVFSPARISRHPYCFSQPIYAEGSLPSYPIVALSDGGVYDNMGLEAVIKTTRIPGYPDAIEPAEFLVVSDGGAPANLRLRSSGLPALGETLLLYRVDEIAREQVTALRTRSIVGEFLERKRQGLFVSLRSEVSRIGPDAYDRYCNRVERLCQFPTALVEMIRSIRTSLDRFHQIESLALMYHAYLMTDAFLWCYRDAFSEGFRIGDSQTPEWLVRFTPEVVAKWSRILTRSARSWRLR